MCANLAEVTTTTDPMTPEAFLENAATGAEWMTLAQTNLLDQRFNKLAKGQRRTQYSTQHFDRYRAGWLVATEEEKRAYRNAQLRGQHLRRPGVPLDTAVFRENIQTLTQRGHIDEELQHQALWVQDILSHPLRKYGFPIVCTTDLHEYLSGRLRPLGEGRANVAPAVFVNNFIKSKIFSPFGTFDATARLSPGRLGYWEYSLRAASVYQVSRSPMDHLVDDGARTRFMHRMVRYGGSLEPEEDIVQEHRSELDEQYLVVLDSSLVPLIANDKGALRKEERLEFEIVAWLYDADWDPPSLSFPFPDSPATRTSDDMVVANPTRDSDGYAGRIKISFGYHLYIGIYPYLVQPGFNLKDIWALHRSEDYSDARRGTSQYSPYVTTFAPGGALSIPVKPAGGVNNKIKAFDVSEQEGGSGTSYATPQVAALAAYLRGLPSRFSDELKEPAMVKRLTQILHRRVPVNEIRGKLYDRDKVHPVIWNGHYGKSNCLLENNADPIPAGVCPDFRDTIRETEPPGGLPTFAPDPKIFVVISLISYYSLQIPGGRHAVEPRQGGGGAIYEYWEVFAQDLGKRINICGANVAQQVRLDSSTYPPQFTDFDARGSRCTY
ncbi:uncharacterized protein B0I36DRAFT_360400 [Microdochium trichocladiopsis]|uniref:Peptidase S8/S53 domain-containing protein n=1 Tax=Microdochium trichocladiopsis TaxID=1682393 RepID=A0A9P8YBE0_9PEZI|nr:uncharacterized protein B0I36DRAFT_360400 [Microdochium trichocladiopsis]KAH7034944.1 hypothetical protein B0I36DRAFT_360400 [Microdochium trichocladiopsis]